MKLFNKLLIILSLILSMNAFAKNDDTDSDTLSDNIETKANSSSTAGNDDTDEDGLPNDWELDLFRTLDRIYGPGTTYDRVWYDLGMTDRITASGVAITRTGSTSGFYCESPSGRISFACQVTSKR